MRRSTIRWSNSFSLIISIGLIVTATLDAAKATLDLNDAAATAAAAVQRQKASQTRADRFPSVEERVRLYMSNWYLPPCTNYTDGFIRYSYHQDKDNHQKAGTVVHLSSSYRPPNVPLRKTTAKKNSIDLSQLDYYRIEDTVQPDQVFYVNRKTLIECADFQVNQTLTATNSSSTLGLHRNVMIAMSKSKLDIIHNMRMYCQDTIRSLQEAWDHVLITDNTNDTIWESTDTDDDVPLLLQYGDMKTSHGYGILEVPHIKKFRSAVSKDAMSTSVTSFSSSSSSSTWSSGCLQHPPTPLSTVHGSKILQPILWKLATHRHYRLLPKVYRHDTPWPLKRNQAIFRGQLTGALDFYNKSVSDYDNCLKSRRCRMVYQHANSRWIDAKLTSTRQRLPAVLNGINMTSPSMTIRHLLQYKAIIMLEGNDVASGLKWALLSQSVVLMPPPRHTSWAMEELLQPWVVRGRRKMESQLSLALTVAPLLHQHYVPLLPDASDVGEKMKWIVKHDTKARWISEQGTLWMEDLVFHPDAKRDDRDIEEEVIRRYRAHFRPAE